MKHLRTTIPGIGMIVGGLVSLCSMLLGGVMPTGEQWQMFGGAIVAGFGLVAAADGKNVPLAGRAPDDPDKTPPLGTETK